MLVISRRAGESVVIGDDVVVTILSTSGNQVRIGITAPRQVSIHREEVHYKIKSQAPVSLEQAGESLAASADCPA